MRKSRLEKVDSKGHFTSELLINSFGTPKKQSWLVLVEKAYFNRPYPAVECFLPSPPGGAPSYYLGQYENDGPSGLQASALMWVFANELDTLTNPRLNGKLREATRVRASECENSQL